MPNETNKAPQSRTALIRWIIGGTFTIFALINGFHFSSLFILLAAFLIFPLPFMQSFFEKKNIKTAFVIVLCVALFFIGVITSPSPASNNSASENESQATTEGQNNISPTPGSQESNKNNTPGANPTPPNSSSSGSTGSKQPESTTSDNKANKQASSSNNNQTAMVWVTSSGKKYHSHSSCSGMKSPSQVSLETAKNKGYSACQKCY